MSEIANPKHKWRLLGVHKHVAGASVREYMDVNSQGWVRRYVATIRGYQNWFIGSGVIYRGDYTFQQILDRVSEIRDRIDANDETVFHRETFDPVVVDKPTITHAEIEAFEARIHAQFEPVKP